MNLPEESFGFQKLTAYKKGKELILLVYKITKTFPRDEIFAITSQIRRAVVSITLNLVEGYSKNSTKEYLRFIDISIGSANETRVLLELAYELNYLNIEDYKNTNQLLTEVLKLLYTYERSLKLKQDSS